MTTPGEYQAGYRAGYEEALLGVLAALEAGVSAKQVIKKLRHDLVSEEEQ